MEIDTVLEILEEFQNFIFLRKKTRMTTEEIEDFLEDYLNDISALED